VSEKRLVAVLASPPLTTSGVRTHARVKLAAEILDFDSFECTNLLDKPTSDIRGLGTFVERSMWVGSRDSILAALDRADAVLLSFGVSPPSGPARAYHAEQLDWLFSEINRAKLPKFACGDRTTHPSRWQRVTSRRYPEQNFEVALAMCLNRYER
jgi:hypothetical protein